MDYNPLEGIASKMWWMFSEHNGVINVGYYNGFKWGWDGVLRVRFSDPYSGLFKYSYSMPSISVILSGIRDAFDKMAVASLGLSDRLELIKSMASGLEKYFREAAISISLSTGKPLREAEYEVEASINALEDAYVLLETYGKYRYDAYRGYTVYKETLGGLALTLSSPSSPILTSLLGIIHGVASGERLIVLKPPSRSPLPVTVLGGILAESGLEKLFIAPPLPAPLLLDELYNSRILSSIYASASNTTINAIFKRVAGARSVLWPSDLSIAVICDDAFTDIAVKTILESRLAGCGDLCLNTTSIISKRDIANEITDKIVSLSEGEVVGDPLHPSTTLGPLRDEGKAVLLESLVDDALSHGSRLLSGRRLGRNLYTPYILDNVPKSSRLLWQRSVVPVLSITSVESCREGISIAKLMPYMDAILIYASNPIKYLDQLVDAEAKIVYINRGGVGRVNYYEDCTNIYTSTLIKYNNTNTGKKVIIDSESLEEPESYR